LWLGSFLGGDRSSDGVDGSGIHWWVSGRIGHSVSHWVKDGDVATHFVDGEWVGVAVASGVESNRSYRLRCTGSGTTKLVSEVNNSHVVLKTDAIVEVNESRCSCADSRHVTEHSVGIGGVWQDEQVSVLVELVHGAHGSVESSVLVWYDVSVPQVKVVVFHVGAQCLILTTG